MTWLTELWFAGENVKESTQVAHGVLMLGLIIAIGLAIGSIQIRNIGLGIAGVLFAGIAFGHYGLTINHEVMGFLPGPAQEDLGCVREGDAVALSTAGPAHLAASDESGANLFPLGLDRLMGGSEPEKTA